MILEWWRGYSIDWYWPLESAALAAIPFLSGDECAVVCRKAVREVFGQNEVWRVAAAFGRVAVDSVLDFFS